MRPLPVGIEPPVSRDERGYLRTVGVEIEVTGLDVDGIADTVRERFGGAVTRHTDYLATVVTPLGNFRVEADLGLLQRIGRSREDSDVPAVVAALRDSVAAIAELVAPFEVSTPPLPYPLLPQVDDLASALAERGALGTRAGVLLALGLQLNPQVPRLDVATIHAHLRAYAVLEPWLRLRRDIDLTRRVSPFVDPYPPAYVERLLLQREPPPLARLIDDYVDYNPTRNRSLDLLPLLAFIAPQQVQQAVPGARINRRPTFHYRLPDSRVGEADQLVTDEWRHWLVVERVAASPSLLALLVSAFCDTLADVGWPEVDQLWPERCESMLAALDYGERSARGGAPEIAPSARL